MAVNIVLAKIILYYIILYYILVEKYSVNPSAILTANPPQYSRVSTNPSATLQLTRLTEIGF